MADANKTYVMLDKLQYYDTKNKAYIGEQVKVATDAIAVLNGTASQDGSIAKSINDAINEFATNVSDDDKVNSFKELVDWVAEHGSEAATMAQAIQANTNAIGVAKAEGVTPTGLYKAIDDLEAAVNGITGGTGLGALAYKDKVNDEVIDDASIAIAKINGLTAALNKIGSIPVESEATNIVDYVNEKTNFTFATEADIDAMFDAE